MPDTDIGATDFTDMKNAVKDYSVVAVDTDGPSDQKETEYQNTEWSQQFGYYKKIPELAAAIDAKARWTVGKGFTSNPLTEIALSAIRGFGKDSFNTILENMVRTYNVGGDSYAEIVRDDEGKLINIKPLDTGSMKIIVNSKGIITRYEQTNKIGNRKEMIKFAPEDILHLSRNRVADEIHGVSIIPAVEEIILARNEAMEDMKQLMHRHVRPMLKFEVDTDDPSRIRTFKSQMDKATNQGENLIIPKGAVVVDVVAVPANATLNPLPWIDRLNQYFYQAVGVPQLVVGGAQEITEASAKILYLAFQQTIEEEQLYVEEQVLAQLNLEIELNPVASLENELLSDNRKDGPEQAATAEDTTVQGVGLNG